MDASRKAQNVHLLMSPGFSRLPRAFSHPVQNFQTISTCQAALKETKDLQAPTSPRAQQEELITESLKKCYYLRNVHIHSLQPDGHQELSQKTTRQQQLQLPFLIKYLSREWGVPAETKQLQHLGFPQSSPASSSQILVRFCNLESAFWTVPAAAALGFECFVHRLRLLPFRQPFPSFYSLIYGMFTCWTTLGTLVLFQSILSGKILSVGLY